MLDGAEELVHFLFEDGADGAAQTPVDVGSAFEDFGFVFEVDEGVGVDAHGGGG